MKRFRTLVVFIVATLAALPLRADETKPAQRVLLLLPKAPLLVELTVTIDEQPFAPEAGAFAVQGQAFLGGRADGSQLQQLLDTDGDGRMSEEEIDAAPARIRSRDADDNEIVTSEEIAGITDFSAQQGDRSLAAIESILAIDGATDWKNVHATLLARYGVKGKLPTAAFRLSRVLGQALDADQNNELSPDELAALAKLAAPLVLDVALGTRTKLRDTVIVAGMADELKKIARIDRGADNTLLLELIGVRLDVLAPNPKPTPQTFAGKAQAYVINYDKDKNGYLEKKELGTAAIAAQFDAWDTDGDGKIFRDELRQALEAADLPNWQKISVAALSLNSSLMAQLDKNGDQRLGVRETAAAAENLRAAETEEIEVMRIAIARGNETYKYLTKGVMNRPLMRANRTYDGSTSIPPGDDWFAHMDTNNDGDITLREFLGTREQFDKLDANQDGAIERSEAE